jgi:hypothetical protein
VGPFDRELSGQFDAGHAGHLEVRKEERYLALVILRPLNRIDPLVAVRIS